MILPNGFKERESIDPKLAVGSSLPMPKELFAILFSLYIINDEKDYLEYSESVGDLIQLKSVLVDKLKIFLSTIPEFDASKVEELATSTPLVKMQIEPLQVTLQIYWKLAKINILDTASSSKERTRLNRYPKSLSFTTNLDLLKYVLSDENGDIAIKGKSLLYNWLLNEPLTADFSKLEEKLKKTLLIFTEDTLFKTWESSNQEIIFQQEGIYKNITTGTDIVNMKGAREIKGTLRNLKSILSKNIHPYLKTSSNNVDLISQSLFSEFDFYKKRVSNYLDLAPKSISINTVNTLEQEEETVERIGETKIFYGAPGTGKSHKVDGIIKGKLERTERVTFHPEYDYASFVGGYKPTMDGKDILYEFVPQAFTNIYVRAWNDLENDYYLVIEEINRGNCAEIFGDLFQLLDRNTSYKITPSKELKEFLEIEFSDNSKIDGKKLILPPNLNLLATMNTSDQSLFPMDSAFKRRWDWEYIPINYDFSDSNTSSKFKVSISENENFSWLSFIQVVNLIIKENENLGMDKCLGNYFIKPKDEIISLDTFINKAIFYLWNDVFKDEMEEQNIFKNKTTYEDFFPIPSNGKEKVKEILDYLKVEIITLTPA